MRTPTSRIDLSGLETTSADEYLTRPDLYASRNNIILCGTPNINMLPCRRQIATFFSGILFATSLYYFLHSPTLTLILSRFLRRRAAAPTADINARQGTLSNASTSTLTHYDPLALVFLLDLVYITTAATQFGSLLSFSSATGAAPCTFLVAWGALGELTSQYKAAGSSRDQLTRILSGSGRFGNRSYDRAAQAEHPFTRAWCIAMGDVHPMGCIDNISYCHVPHGCCQHRRPETHFPVGLSLILLH
jgi:hypothetical protein